MRQKVNLTEYIHPQMDLLFVALNAPEVSNENAHWFTYNLSFWNLLNRTGIITQNIHNKLQGDEKVFGDTSINYNHWSIGVTDLNRRDVMTNSNYVEVNAGDVQRIMNILKKNKVSRVCLMHSKVGQAFREYAHEITFNGRRYGQIGKYKDTAIFEVPFHNATVPNKEQYYAMLIGSVKDASIAKKQKEVHKKPIELKEIHPATITQGSKSFKLPTTGNAITDKDIAKGQLRITVTLKKYFPKESQIVRIKYLGKNKEVNYTFRDTRSSILMVGREFMKLNSIDSRSSIAVKIVDGKYILTRN